MRISFIKYPVDIFLCILWSIIIIPMFLIDINGVLWIILASPSLFFIPGYLILSILFPKKKTDKNSIDVIERFVIGISLSLIVISSIGIGFNYTRWGLKIPWLLFSTISLFSIVLGVIAIYRWLKTKPCDRFTISLSIPWRKPRDKTEKIFISIIAILLIIVVILFVYSIMKQKPEEHFTEFYILGASHKTEEYPEVFKIGDNKTIIIGIINHEHRTINYTVEIWLINQSSDSNGTMDTTNISQMWFIDKITTTLEHVDINEEKNRQIQWEYNYSLNLDKKGFFKLVFILLISPTENYVKDKNYSDQAKQILERAYEELHLWIKVN